MVSPATPVGAAIGRPFSSASLCAPQDFKMKIVLRTTDGRPYNIKGNRGKAYTPQKDDRKVRLYAIKGNRGKAYTPQKDDRRVRSYTIIKIPRSNRGYFIFG